MTSITPPPKPTQADYEGQNRVHAWDAYMRMALCDHKADISIMYGQEMTCSKCDRPISFISDIQRAGLLKDGA